MMRANRWPNLTNSPNCRRPGSPDTSPWPSSGRHVHADHLRSQRPLAKRTLCAVDPLRPVADPESCHMLTATVWRSIIRLGL
jgi:hypothetical protein